MSVPACPVYVRPSVAPPMPTPPPFLPELPCGPTAIGLPVEAWEAEYKAEEAVPADAGCYVDPVDEAPTIPWTEHTVDEAWHGRCGMALIRAMLRCRFGTGVICRWRLAMASAAFTEHIWRRTITAPVSFDVTAFWHLGDHACRLRAPARPRLATIPEELVSDLTPDAYLTRWAIRRRKIERAGETIWVSA